LAFRPRNFNIGFDKKPSSALEVLQHIAPDLQPFNYYDNPVSACDAATAVYKQLVDQQPITVTEAEKEIASGWFKGCPEYPRNTEVDQIVAEFRAKFKVDIHTARQEKKSTKEKKVWFARWEAAWKKNSDAYRKAVDQAALTHWQMSCSRFIGKKMFIVSFSDNDGEATLEHGEIFYRIPHIQISHH